MVISFNPKYNIGDKVNSAIDPEIKYIIIGYSLMGIDSKGNVLIFNYGCSDALGNTIYFREYELELYELIKFDE